MKWAIEIMKTSLERRLVVDLLESEGVDFEVVDGIGSDLAFTKPLFDQMDSKEVWSEAKKLREVMIGPAETDPDFMLGAVIDYSTSEPKHHYFLEAEPAKIEASGGTVTMTVSPPKGLSEEQVIAWQAEHAEQEYQTRLEALRSKFVSAYREPRAAKMQELLKLKKHTGESLYRIYELAEGHPSNRKRFHMDFGISQDEFDRFRDAVHNPVVSGDFARHTYEETPHTSNPMTISEAEKFVRSHAESWLKTLRKP